MRTAGISDKVLLPLAAGLAAGLVLVAAGLAAGAEAVWQAGLGVLGTALAGAGIGYNAQPSPVELAAPNPAEPDRTCEEPINET